MYILLFAPRRKPSIVPHRAFFGPTSSSAGLTSFPFCFCLTPPKPFQSTKNHFVAMSDSFHPYTHLYSEPSGPGDRRPTALQVVQDNGVLGQWAGRVALVTGATSGIGIETARALHATGADVYFTARDLQKGAATREDILKTSGGKGRLEVIELNLDSLESVRNAVKAFLQQSNTLNVLVNNAGEYALDVDGVVRDRELGADSNNT